MYLCKRIANYTFFMRFEKIRLLYLSIMLLCPVLSYSRNDVVEKINENGKFDNWCRREIKESALIGGATKYLYEFYGSGETLHTGKEPFTAPDGYLWRTNNVLAIVLGIVKTNNTVFPEPRGEGYCARVETHIEKVKALGIINMDVCCQGCLLVGSLPEPIRDTDDPMAKVIYGLPFDGRPEALVFDYKAEVGREVIRGTGFTKLKPMGYPDYAEVTFVLQKRWEDEDGNVHALRVGTAIQRFTSSVREWQNDYTVEVHYGDITSKPFYKEYMGLKTDPETAYHAINSRGENVIVQEDGWADEDADPNYMMLHFLTSCEKAFYGGVGNTLWLDNVRIVMPEK